MVDDLPTIVRMRDYVDASPNTFVAFDLNDGRQIVGIFQKWTAIRYPEPTLIEGRLIDSEEAFQIEEAGSRRMVILPSRYIKTGYWAQMGYRAEKPWEGDTYRG